MIQVITSLRITIKQKTELIRNDAAQLIVLSAISLCIACDWRDKKDVIKKIKVVMEIEQSTS